MCPTSDISITGSLNGSPERPASPLGRLYLVATPRPGIADADFLARVRAAIDGGVDIVQLRCKDREGVEYMRLGAELREIAAAARIPFIVNDRVDIALAVGADGVHLGQADLPHAWARRILPPTAVIGRSSHSAADAARILEEVPGYFAAGPVWETPTKPGRPAAGLAYVRHVASLHTTLPWYAIGGISHENVEQVLEAGATRIAVVRAILDAPDPASAANSFRELLRGAPREEEAACT